MISRRTIQTLVHPQKFIRLLKLTDGSIIRVSTLTPPPNSSSKASVSLLNLDSANHPSWNPELRDKLLLDDRGQVAKFRAKFERSNDNEQELSSTSTPSDYNDFFEMDPNLNIEDNSSQIKTKVKVPIKQIPKKKKK